MSTTRRVCFALLLTALDLTGCSSNEERSSSPQQGGNNDQSPGTSGGAVSSTSGGSASNSGGTTSGKIMGGSPGSDTGGGGSSSTGGGSASGGVSEAGSGNAPASAGCGLPAAAFCNTFDAPHPGGRSGELDELLFGVARLTSKASPGAELEAWAPGKAIVCGTMTSGIVPGSDFRVCNGQLNESFNDDGEFAFHSTMIRQPFDFAGRTGTIVFDVDAKAVAHGWWSEVWISDEPVPGPYQDSPGVATFPRNAFGIQLLGDWCPGSAQGKASAMNDLFVFKDYKLASDTIRGGFEVQECFATQDQLLNHFELKVSAKKLELYATDAGKQNLRLVASVAGLNLPFTRGYVHLQHTHYNAAKANVSPSQTYRWDNVGFDGPVLRAPRTYEVPDSLQVNELGNTNIGYSLDPGRTTSFQLAEVDLASATSAGINCTLGNFDGTKPARFKLNDGPWHDAVVKNPITYQQGTVHIEVPLSELVSGTNTLTFSNPNTDYMIVANLDLTVNY